MAGIFSRSKNQAGPKVGARRSVQRERFGAYFPRLFAYCFAATGDEKSAQDAVATAFAGVFTLPDMREEDFEIELFRAARQFSREQGHAHYTDGLNSREREVISLLFDAQLNRDQVSEILNIREETVVNTLLRGLRKLRPEDVKASAGNPVASLS